MKRIVLVIAGFAVAAPARAADFTVGPGGTYATIQAGIDAALAAGSDHTVKVAQGTYRERLRIPDADFTNFFLVGGYLPGFAERATALDPDDPSSSAATTIVDAEGLGPALTIENSSGGWLRIFGFSFTGGFSTWDEGERCPIGGGIQMALSGRVDVFVDSSVIEGNEISIAAACPAQGGGVGAQLSGNAGLHLDSARVRRNAANSATNTASGGGIYVISEDGSRFSLYGSLVEENEARSANDQASGGGIFVASDSFTSSAVTVELDANRFVDNRVSASSPCVAGCVWIGAADRGTLRRNRWLRNQHEGAPQLSLVTAGTARLVWGDDEIAGATRGATVDVRDESALDATNLTIADHSGAGLSIAPFEKGAVSLFNTIAYRNGVNAEIPPGVRIANSLIGVNPFFVDPEGGSYNLLPGSPAIDAGSELTPAGLGISDVTWQVRVQGAAVDIGAHEASGGTPGASGRYCRVDRFGEPPHDIPPVPDHVPVCNCLQDDVSRNLLCGFHFPDFFAVVRVPWPVPPLTEAKAEWTFHPWGPYEAPFEMTSVLLVGGKEVPLDGKGTSGKLREGKDVRGGLKLPGIAESGVLRTVVRHLPPGAKAPSVELAEVAIEIEGKPKG